jgi:hypothetical protein
VRVTGNAVATDDPPLVVDVGCRGQPPPTQVGHPAALPQERVPDLQVRVKDGVACHLPAIVHGTSRATGNAKVDDLVSR